MDQGGETPAGPIRRLMREQPRVAMGTIDRDNGEPYASLAMVALAHDGSPLLLLSDLADYTRNLSRDPRCSLLYDGTVGAEVALAEARTSVQGHVAEVDEPLLCQRYVRRHPDAGIYVGFGDFHLFRMTVARAHLVAGFGRIHWVGADDILAGFGPAGDLASSEVAVVEHMNTDHADAVQLYAEKLAGRAAGSWLLTGVDPRGADLRLGGETARIWFDQPVQDADSVKAELVRLAKLARSMD